MNHKFKFFLPIALLLFQGCVSVSSSEIVKFPVNEGRLIPQESALQYVNTNLEDTNENGILLYAIEGSAIEKAEVKYRMTGGTKRHYGYYGLSVEVRKYKWSPEKGKPYSLILHGTAGKDTVPGRRVYWFADEVRAKDVAMALIALGAKSLH